MKQIIAIIREECVELTRSSLAGLGIAGIAVIPVIGRGQQKGAVHVPDQDGSLGRNNGPHLRRSTGLTSGMGVLSYLHPGKKKTAFRFLPKQMLILIADDEDVRTVIDVLVAVNQSGRPGDGKIFVCPIGRALGIDTDPS